MLQSIYTQDIARIQGELGTAQEVTAEIKPHDPHKKPYHLKMFQKTQESFNTKLAVKAKNRETIQYETIISNDLETCLQNLSNTEKVSWKNLEKMNQQKCILEYVQEQKNLENMDPVLMDTLKAFLLDKLENGELKSTMIDFNSYKKVINGIKNLKYTEGTGFVIEKPKKCSKNVRKNSLIKLFGGK